MSHVVAAFILILLPLTGYFEVRKLKSDISDQTKESSYLRIYLWYAMSTTLVFTTKPFSSLFTLSSAGFSVPSLVNYILWSIVTYQVFMLVVPSILIYYSSRMQATVAEEYKSKEYMFPRSRKSMVMFAALAFVVGIAEEIIFRGFLYSYFQDQWGLAAVISFILVNALFGLGHYQQGKAAIVDTALLGAAMSWIYINRGSLLLPIIFHILYDLKIVYFTWVIQRKKELRGV